MDDKKGKKKVDGLGFVKSPDCIWRVKPCTGFVSGILGYVPPPPTTVSVIDLLTLPGINSITDIFLFLNSHSVKEPVGNLAIN